MNDGFITALNTQRSTSNWMDALAENLSNIYTPGYRENQFRFNTFLGGTYVDTFGMKTDQGKSLPGTAPENIFLEGQGYFVTKNDKGQTVYTRLGEFQFDAQGVYKTKNGARVQGYILNDEGKVLSNSSEVEGDVASMPTTDIKLWIDPSNGKYLGKYDEFEFGGNGILYGKSDGGKLKTPLYKVAIHNFNNPEGLLNIQKGEYVETEESGKPVIGNAQVRGGLIEQSNVDFKTNIAYYQQAKMQMELSNKLISTNKQLLEEAMRLIQ
ncbi:MAG: hypothetical protein PHX18_04110 [Candidatus Gastranaerophilales bacterium]|nr:hypothetical protein [Candidatus Gastranaerophilales bacterium]